MLANTLIMKKVTSVSFLFIALSVIFFSCKKDKTEGHSGSIQKKWYYHKIITTNKTTGVTNSEDIYGSLWYVEFKADGTLYDSDAGNRSYTLTNNDKKLTLVSNGGATTIYDVTKLTATELQLSGEVDNSSQKLELKTTPQ